MRYKETIYIVGLIESMIKIMPLKEKIDFLNDVISSTSIKRDYYLRDLQAPIEDLDLNVRAYNCLKRAGIYTIDELTSHTRTDLFKVKNLGLLTLERIEQKLALNGLKLKEEEEE